MSLLIKEQLTFLKGRRDGILGSTAVGVVAGILSVVIYMVENSFSPATIHDAIFGGSTLRIILMAVFGALALVPLSPAALFLLIYVYDMLVAALFFTFGFWMVLLTVMCSLAGWTPEVETTASKGLSGFAMIGFGVLVFGPLTFREFQSVAMDRQRKQSINHWWGVYFAWALFMSAMMFWAYWNIGWK